MVVYILQSITRLDSAPPSDTESVHGESTNRRLPLNSVPKIEDAITLKKTSGKKKQRRYHNSWYLPLLTFMLIREDNF